MANNNTEILQSEEIEFWQYGKRMGFISRKEAIQLVNEGWYKVINNHAIEWIGA